MLYSKKCVRLGLMIGCTVVLEDILFADEEVLPYAVFAGTPVMLQYLPARLLLRALDVPWTLPTSLLSASTAIEDRRGLFLLAPLALRSPFPL